MKMFPSTPVQWVIVVEHQPGCWTIEFLAVATDATASQNRLHVAVVLDIVRASRVAKPGFVLSFPDCRSTRALALLPEDRPAKLLAVAFG